MTELPYLAGYPADLRARAHEWLVAGELEERLKVRYPERHEIRSNRDLATYVQDTKARWMKNAAPLGQVLFDDKLHVVHGALGLHTTTTRVHGAKLRKHREVRVASVFKEAPLEFLRAIVVHELAHMKHSEHDRDFYRLCEHMEPEYHQLEFDLRLYLTALEWQN